LLNSLLKPFGALSGGLVPPLIPPGASAANLAKPPTSAAGAAARIQTQEADAKARREAVRYLGTVDCRYYPEAAAALATALRTDPSECVRYEAALALNRSCCCTPKTVAALRAAASGRSDDQNPPECSERVRAAAESALMRCALSAPPVPPVPQLPLEKPIPSAVGPVPADQGRPVATTTARPAPVPALAAQPVSEIPAGQRGLLQITRHALLPDPAPPRWTDTPSGLHLIWRHIGCGPGAP
jgi:hypothetical protein